MVVSGVAGSIGVTQAGVVAVCIWFLSFFIGMEGGVYWHGGGVLIGMEEVCLLGWRGVFIAMNEVSLLVLMMCIYWHGGGGFIGMEEVCLFTWRRCVY